MTIPEAQITAANTTGFPERYSKSLSRISVRASGCSGLRIVVDCANGAMSQVAPALLERLGAKLNVIHATPYGKNINAAAARSIWNR